MNWGRVILIVYLLFVGGMVFMVIKSFNNDYDLVTDDYYAEELKFEDQISASKNAVEFRDSIIINKSAEDVEVQFPSAFKTATTGELHFYKAANADDDIIMPLQLDENGRQVMRRNTINAGFYTVKIKWVKNNINYYTEKTIRL